MAKNKEGYKVTAGNSFIGKGVVYGPGDFIGEEYFPGKEAIADLIKKGKLTKEKITANDDVGTGSTGGDTGKAGSGTGGGDADKTGASGKKETGSGAPSGAVDSGDGSGAGTGT